MRLDKEEVQNCREKEKDVLRGEGGLYKFPGGDDVFQLQ
jgi:hypothetical protein